MPAKPTYWWHCDGFSIFSFTGCESCESRERAHPVWLCACAKRCESCESAGPLRRSYPLHGLLPVGIQWRLPCRRPAKQAGRRQPRLSTHKGSVPPLRRLHTVRRQPGPTSRFRALAQFILVPFAQSGGRFERHAPHVGKPRRHSEECASTDVLTLRAAARPWLESRILPRRKPVRRTQAGSFTTDQPAQCGHP